MYCHLFYESHCITYINQLTYHEHNMYKAKPSRPNSSNFFYILWKANLMNVNLC